ncbi:PfkB family carbohydrate kinase [Hymenobacter sp. M29]|uniref:PfkB family carbohydrate kinase n=1 Tax=Hymenobacter mellowenesis TaxID=3063995 RepID=A0ABT9AJ90_9BACT|nr:PfkB family carbohydrate kinase [Hymenobacter sp. M29]MDO7849941.1 PfkB family carbohydrate kinase [Hymenobacter sp. M29]
MKPELTIVGGTYLELCIEPESQELYGSGMRAAAALSRNVTQLKFISCVGQDYVEVANSVANAFGFQASFEVIDSTVSFTYYHPLSTPVIYPESALAEEKFLMQPIKAEALLVYGQIEAKVFVEGNYVVYDPQNHVPWRETGSKANHLALVLNSNEAYLLSGLSKSADLESVGKFLLEKENAEVVIIKNGSKGALSFDKREVCSIPLFKTDKVWPIGSGDIFSAAFAWQWMVEKKSAGEAARIASLCTAYYCQSRLLPLPLELPVLQALPAKADGQIVYLAGPFFTIAERWLINELRDKLTEFGNRVFSPMHDVGPGTPHDVVKPDLDGITQSSVVLAVASGLDAGTLFEIGYARALGKRVVVYAENTTEHDLTMMIGSDCEIVEDFSTAIYQTSWQ